MATTHEGLTMDVMMQVAGWFFLITFVAALKQS
jgi:hypothetical protein